MMMDLIAANNLVGIDLLVDDLQPDEDEDEDEEEEE